MREQAARPGLAEYYLIEALNAYGTTVFFLGVFFHARFLHGFSDTENLLLAATQGAAYVLATRAGGRFADRVGPDRSVALGLAGMCLALLAGWQSTEAWALFAAVALYSASTALTWPALEAAIARSPGKVPLARRTGLYNMTWSFTGSVGFFAGGALFAYDPEAVFWAPLAAHALELVALAARSRTLRSSTPPRLEITPKTNTPPSQIMTAEGWREAGGPSARYGTVHTDASRGRFHGGSAPSGAAGAAVTPLRDDAYSFEERKGTDGVAQRQDPAANLGPEALRGKALTPEAHARFLRAAWLANGLSYFLFGAFAALAPTLGERLGLGPRLAIWMVSAYLFARSASFVCFWAWSGWEYRRGWLAGALLVPPAAFAAVFFSPSPQVAIGALAVLGAMSGLAYSVSLHASLDRVGREGEGGGLHEWVIGLGTLLGPLAGVAGVRLPNGISGAGVLVTVLGAAAALAGLAPLARRLERRR